MLPAIVALGFATFSATFAHPGHSISQEAAERTTFLRQGPKSVRSCNSALRSAGIAAAALKRRSDLADYARVESVVGKDIDARDLADYEYSHASSRKIHVGDDEVTLFSDDSSYVLQPEVTQGPYFVDGELIRGDIKEDQQGVPLFLDIQIIDTSRCEPVSALFVDLWHANATGVYSGVSAPAFLKNGDSNDTTNIDKTFLRGVQQTDVNGVAQFKTIFPGHYTGRTDTSFPISDKHSPLTSSDP